VKIRGRGEENPSFSKTPDGRKGWALGEKEEREEKRGTNSRRRGGGGEGPGQSASALQMVRKKKKQSLARQGDEGKVAPREGKLQLGQGGDDEKDNSRLTEGSL